MNNHATIGHNNPPDPIDEAIAPYMDAIEEAENWLDGSPVETEESMKAVDAIIAEVRKAKSDLAKAKKASTAPLHDAWKAEVARWKPTEEDVERRLKGLAALVEPFKIKLAEEKEAAIRAARAEAERKEREARAAAEQANVSDYDAMVDASDKADAAIEAKKAAVVASNDKVKGLRTLTKYEITDHKALLHWIAQNRRDDLTAFIEEWARRNHRNANADGLRVWTEKGAY